MGYGTRRMPTTRRCMACASQGLRHTACAYYNDLQGRGRIWGEARRNVGAWRGALVALFTTSGPVELRFHGPPIGCYRFAGFCRARRSHDNPHASTCRRPQSNPRAKTAVRREGGIAGLDPFWPILTHLHGRSQRYEDATGICTYEAYCERVTGVGRSCRKAPHDCGNMMVLSCVKG
jgi:hypothetical protein